jgi:hypothetical protein
VLGVVFEPKREEIAKGRKLLGRRGIRNKLSSHAGHVACMEIRKICTEISADDVKQKRSLGRYRHKWEDYVKTDHTGGIQDTNWIHFARNREYGAFNEQGNQMISRLQRGSHQGFAR